MALIFVAVPTKGVAKDRKLLEHFPRDVARLHEIFPSHTFVVPMIQDYALLPYLQTEATWEKWGNHCEALIKVSDEVWVIMYEGYAESVGVKAEIELANKLGKRVMMVHPSQLEKFE